MGFICLLIAFILALEGSKHWGCFLFAAVLLAGK